MGTFLLQKKTPKERSLLDSKEIGFFGLVRKGKILAESESESE